MTLTTPLWGTVCHQQAGACYDKSTHHIRSAYLHPLRKYYFIIVQQYCYVRNLQSSCNLNNDNCCMCVCICSTCVIVTLALPYSHPSLPHHTMLYNMGMTWHHWQILTHLQRQCCHSDSQVVSWSEFPVLNMWLCVCGGRNVEEMLKAKGESVKKFTKSEDGTVEVTWHHMILYSIHGGPKELTPT